MSNMFRANNNWRISGLLCPAVAFIIFTAGSFPHAVSSVNAAEASMGSIDRGQVIDRQTLRGVANQGGPEDWPETSGLSTATDGFPAPAPVIADMPSQRPVAEPVPAPQAPVPQAVPVPPASPVQPVQNVSPPQIPAGVPSSGVLPPPPTPPVPADHSRPATTPGPAAVDPNAPQREVIYVDEQGNPVPKPPEPDKMLAEAYKNLESGKYDDALSIFEEVKQLPGLAQNLRESALYGISDAMWGRYADNPLAGYEPIISATNEAMNSNLRSARVPDALLRLGLANVNVDNLEDANGYIVALMRRYPDYPGVAQGFTALGKAQLKKGLDSDAEQSFGIVLDKYPESNQLQDATVGLATSLVKQGKDERAQIILDFLSKRWPRYYINDPDFLLMQAANDEKLKRMDSALDLYWLYVNIDPMRPGNEKLLLRMGDEYMKQGNPDAANFIYSQIDSNFPDTPSAITARLRLAEKGIYESPINYAQMSQVFDRGGSQPLWRVYNELIDSSSTSPEAVLARLKQAMWLLWNKQYAESMGKAVDFIDSYPEHPDAQQARDVLWLAFQKELEQSLAEHNYGRILLLWNGFPMIRERYGAMDAPLRYALAQGWLERGDEAKCFELLDDFLDHPMDPQYGNAVFSQFFNHYLEQGAWDKILELGKKVQNWNLQPELKNQLDYALALSAQNLNLAGTALERWKQLANRTDLPLYQQAYATYFLAKDAEQRRDIREAYENNRKVVGMFTQLAEERSDKADPERIKEAVTSLMDICEVGNRIPEALQWVHKYSVYVPENSPEYPGLRFREARLYRKLGDNTRSQALLESIVSGYPESPFAQAASAELRTFDVSRDLQRYLPSTPQSQNQSSSGSTSGNWSSTAPSQ